MADRVVIMGEGEIAQMGAPKDIYRTPANRFVAEFVGRNNILSGTVKSLRSKVATVETPSGGFKVPVPDGRTVAAGDVVSFSVSADLVHLSAKKPKGDNVVACSLISEEFVGAVVTLFLESADGTEFKAQVQEREVTKIDLKADSAVYLSWATDAAHLLGQ